MHKSDQELSEETLADDLSHVEALAEQQFKKGDHDFRFDNPIDIYTTGFVDAFKWLATVELPKGGKTEQS